MASPLILSPKPTKPTVRAERCETCTSGHFPDGAESGECRLDPPKGQFIPAMTKLGQQGVQLVASCPPVQRDAWCVSGFKPRLAS